MAIVGIPLNWFPTSTNKRATPRPTASPAGNTTGPAPRNRPMPAAFAEHAEFLREARAQVDDLLARVQRDNERFRNNLP